MADFKFFSDAYLQKGGDPKTGVKVGGVLMTENVDVDGEEVIPIDWSYFDKGFGKIKYEHVEFKGPKAYIGFPLGRSKKGKTHSFHGELIPFDPEAPEEKLTPQERLAKETYTLLKHIEEHNKKHPEKPQRAGWSIEGNYVKHKSLKPGQVGARIVDVVFTTQPRNMETFATILKSLSAEGTYGMTPETQTEWAALRSESLNNSTKNETSSSSSNKKEKTTMFKTKHDVYKSCKETKGMSHEEALKEANAWDEQQRKDRQEDYSKAEKSLANSKDKLQKSLQAANEVEGIEIDVDTKFIKKSLQKSLQADGAGNIDVQAFLKDVNDTVMAVADAIPLLADKVDKIAKSLAGMSESRIEEIDAVDYLRKATAVNNEQLNQTNADLALLVQTLKKSLGGKVSTDNLSKSNKTEKRETVDNDAADELEPTKLQKSQVTQVLDTLVEKKTPGITAKDVTMWEGSTYMSEPVKKLFKSHAKEILNLE